VNAPGVPAAGRRPRWRVAEEARTEVLLQVRLWYFLSGAAASGIMALLALWAPAAAGGGAPAAMAWLVLGLLSAGAMRLPARAVVPAMAALMLLGSLIIFASAGLWGAGSSLPALGVLGALVCVLCTAAGWRAGLALAALDVALLAALHFGLEPASAPSTWLRFGAQALPVLVGLAAGAMLSRVLARYMRAASERESRFRSLLALAADAYWEIDASYRISSASYQHDDSRSLAPRGGLGQVPWELPRFACDAEVLDAVIADLDRRAAFRDVPVRWRGRSGSEPEGDRIFLVSGEPRFDGRGIFAGYWGVARDVTHEHAARAALVASESRYHELFSRIPTPLVLHCGVRPIDANPAALLLFGHADLAGFVGSDFILAYESGDSRERARRRMEQLQGQPPGTALPVTDFRLQVGGRRVSVRGTGVVVDAEGGPAILSIFVDDTERLAAEEMVRRSEAMLSHLVATSPDLITLTDLASGRYAMVNKAFERVTGYSASEAIGRTSLELGVWPSDAARQEFVHVIQSRGEVADMPTQFVTKAGTRVAMLVSAARFTMDRREYMVLNARDVSESERSRLEREAILDNASVGIAFTRGGRFVLANPHFEAMLGWPPGAIVGQSGRVPWVSDADYAEVGRVYGPALARGESVEFESLFARHDGSTFLGLIRAHAIDRERPADGGTVWIAEDITQRREAEQTLARARDDAEAANRAKSAFLANTSHELRTPLNGIVGLAQLARDPALAPEQRERYLGQIADSAQSLAEIISDILDLSKIEAGKLVLEQAVFDPAELLDTLHHAWAPLADARGLVFETVLAPGTAGPVLGDALRLRQILANFLNNAIKFTERGRVQLKASRPDAGEELLVQVQDSGPGIDAETQARLFRPFTQADQSTTRRFGGSGLGLSICRELAALMGGTVGVDSQPGQGSTFWVRLPLPRSATPSTPLAPAAPGAPGAPAPDPSRLAGTRVLLVEDNAVNMLIAVAMLERWGVRVEQAHDGLQAQAAVQRAAERGEPFELVLMDVQMPVMGGHEATRALRAAGHRMPVVALTAAALVSERDEALQAGMDDFLTKPIDIHKLGATLLRWCGSAR
jgi:PAS domain S-box-containing protein